MLKYNSLFSYTFCCKRSYSNIEPFVKIISDYTGLPERDANEFVGNHNLKRRNPDYVVDLFESFKKLGYATEEILANPKLFNSQIRVHQQHFWTMEEAGFSNLKPQVVQKASTLFRWKIQKLKLEHFIDKKVNVPDSFLSYINNSDFLKKVEIIYNEEMTLSSIHFLIARQFLAWRLGATDEEVRALYISHYGMAHKSFRVMEENISFAESLGFSSRKIVKCGYVIQNYPEYPKQTLREFPTLAGADMRVAMKENPTLIVTPTKRIRETYKVLKKFNIPDESIKKEMGIFQVAPETVRKRLEEFKHDPDTAPLLKISKVLKLLLYNNRIKTRLPILQECNLKCTNFQVLARYGTSSLEQYIKEGKDVNYRNDVVEYFKRLLGVENGNLWGKLNQHRFCLNVPLKDVGETFEYLLHCGFRKESICEALWILLYPVDKVKGILHQLKDDKTKHFLLMSQVQKLNLMLYEMEKDHHFKGHGVFTDIANEFDDEQTAK